PCGRPRRARRRRRGRSISLLPPCVAQHQQAIPAETLRLGQVSPALAEEVSLVEHADRVKAAAVDLARTGAPERVEMLGGGVSLVLVETVARVALVQRAHLRVARGLGEDRGCGDRLVTRIAIDERLGAAGQFARALV